VINDVDKKIEELWESNHPSASRSYPITRVAYEEERTRLRAAARKSIDYTLDALQLVFANLISKIADVNIIIGPSYGHRPQSSSSSSFTDRQDNNKKRKLDRQQGSTPRASQQKVEPQDSTACPGCGYVRKFRDGKPYCPRNDGAGCSLDPRRNISPDPWASSATGKAWAAKGQKFLPKDVSLTLANFVPRTPGTQPNKQNAAKGTEISISTINSVTTNYNNNILPFSLRDIQEERGVEKESKNLAVFKAAAISHSLLDSGAIGSCVISPNFFDYIYLRIII
jgi:hypothetical protein